MATTADLVQKLRKRANEVVFRPTSDILLEAAAALEALQAEHDEEIITIKHGSAAEWAFDHMAAEAVKAERDRYREVWAMAKEGLVVAGQYGTIMNIEDWLDERARVTLKGGERVITPISKIRMAELVQKLRSNKRRFGEEWMPSDLDLEAADVIEALQEKLNSQAAWTRHFTDMECGLQRDIAQLTAERDKYREALEFYADGTNWVPVPPKVLGAARRDRGERARAALKGRKE